MSTLNWKGKVVSYVLIGAACFGIGYGAKSCIGETKPDYSKTKVAQGYYQNPEIELKKSLNKNKELELYLEDKNVKIPLKDDLLLGDNQYVYDNLEKRLEKNPKENEDILDKMFQTSYFLKVEANVGNKIKTGCVSPSDILLKYNKTSEGDYISIENKLTNENLQISKCNEKIQLGTFDYQYEYFKQIVVEKASNGYNNFVEKVKEWFPFLGGLFQWGS
jgi:hypothetical protein